MRKGEEGDRVNGWNLESGDEVRNSGLENEE